MHASQQRRDKSSRPEGMVVSSRARHSEGPCCIKRPACRDHVTDLLFRRPDPCESVHSSL
jgi:hypothetical protein